MRADPLVAIGRWVKPVHLERTGDFILPAPLERAMPLFSPEGERGWVPGWNPVYLHPDHPSVEAGTVFRTAHQDEETLWLVLRYDAVLGEAEYLRVTPGSRMGTVRVRFQDAGGELTRVSVTYALTALSPAGEAVLAELTAERYARMLEEWREAIVGYLERGST